jgi:DNA mismatch endonuclease (patch repair protein)
MYVKKMTDNLSKEKRSKVMASIRGKNTQPELTIRKLLWSEGKRYRIHDRTVFGTPDMSNKTKKVAVFVDGCFWHGCSKCYKEPKTNTEYWKNKIACNLKRRKIVIKHLGRHGWNILEFWEHRVIQEPKTVAKEISRYL